MPAGHPASTSPEGTLDWAFLERSLTDSGRRRRRAAAEGRLRLITDATALMLAVVSAGLTGWAEHADDRLAWLGTAAAGVLLALVLGHAYRPAPRLALAVELRSALIVPPFVVLGLWCMRSLFAGEELAATPLVFSWLLLTCGVVTSRAAARRLMATRALGGRLRQRALVIGAGEVGRRVARRLLDAPATGLVPVGYLDKEPREAQAADDLPVLGASWDLERVIAEHDVHAVVVSFSTAPDEILLGIVHRCRALGVNVLLVPRLFEVDGARTAVHHLGALPVISVAQSDPRGWEFRVKYALDRVLAAALLVASAPVLVAVAIAVLVTSGRPVLFRQRRVGRDGQVFEILKFRTMRGAPEDGGQANGAWAAAVTGAALAAAGPIPDQDRRTPIGAFLGRSSLDELPQLFNVLRGDMSLVGPRPELVPYVEQFSGAVYRYADRHRVRSGITGWAQVNGLRGDTSLADRVELDNHYIESWTFWLDVRILVRSVRAVLGHPNAR